MRDWAIFAAQDESSLIYGRRPAFLVKWGFWLTAIHREFFSFLAGIILLPVAVFVALRARAHQRDRWSWILAGAGIAQIIIVLWGFTQQIPEVTRYLLALLTSALIPMVWLLAPIAPRRRFLALVLGLAGAQWGWIHASTLGLLTPPPRSSAWLVNPNPDPTYSKDLDHLIQRTTTPETAYRYFVNGYETPWLNANTLSFHAAKNRLTTGIRAYYTSLGYGARDVEASWKRVLDMQAEGYISVSPGHHATPPSFMNQVATPILELVDTGPFFSRVAFENRHDILLYRRAVNRQ